MTMGNDMDKDNDRLERHFAAARTAGPAVPDTLMARVLADAAAHQPAPVCAPAPAPLRTLRARLWAAIGGAGGIGAGAGLAAAALSGVWIGFAQPGPAEGLGFIERETFEMVELIPDFDLLIPGADEMEG